MKRGIFRIISGVLLILSQLMSMSSDVANTSTDFWYNVGYYSPAITGIILLIFGIRAYKNNAYSKLIIHDKNKKVHTIMKWVGFILSTLLFIYYFYSFFSYIDVFSLFNIFGFLCFSVYSLFYMYKKPSSLFSATLIFIGVYNIYNFINYLTYIWYWWDSEYFNALIFTVVLPTFVAGILYIVIASVIHKENFSVKAVKTLGWIVFMLEILRRVVYLIIVSHNLYFITDFVTLMNLLFVIVLTLYISVFKINTLRNAPASATNSQFENQSCSPSNIELSKSIEPVNNSIQTTDQIRFCRKCGEKLINDSSFCRKCGTEIVY